jgi:CoA:oxalate CoA-transferase
MFATNKKRTENLVALNEILDPIFAAKTAKEWLQIFEKSGVPCAPINTIDKLFDDEQLKARNMIVNIHDPKAGDLKIAGNPIKMTSIPEKNDREAAPEIGQDNVEIFTTLLGMDKATIEQLKNEGVI